MNIFFCGLKDEFAKCNFQTEVFTTKEDSDSIKLCSNKIPLRNCKCYYKQPAILKRSNKIPNDEEWERLGYD